MLGSVGEIQAKGPAGVQSMLGWSGLVGGGFSVGFYPVKCALGFGYYGLLWTGVALPVVMIATVLFLVLVFFHLPSIRGGRGGGGGREGSGIFSTKQIWVGVCVINLFILYGAVSKNLFEVFDCLGPYHEGQYLLQADTSVSCFQGQHSVTVVLASILLALWSLGVPGMVLYLAHPQRHHLRCDPRFRFLFVGYASHCLWWEATVMVRKLLLQVLGVFVASPQVRRLAFLACCRCVLLLRVCAVVACALCSCVCGFGLFSVRARSVCLITLATNAHTHTHSRTQTHTQTHTHPIFLKFMFKIPVQD